MNDIFGVKRYLANYFVKNLSFLTFMQFQA